MTLIEIIGYTGSLLIATSLTMSNIVKLRWINLFGASTFAFYGGVIGAYPVLILNSFITLIDIYHLIQIYSKKDFFSIEEIDPKSGFYLKRFLEYYKNDIKIFFPQFCKDDVFQFKVVFILRNMIPAGLFVYNEISQNTIEIKLDYAIPDYRDFGNSKYFYSSEAVFLKNKGYEKLIVYSDQSDHQKYLIKSGFEKETGNRFIKNI